MDRPAKSGEAQTVLGPVAASALGVTMVHEHLLIDLTCLFTEPADGSERDLARQPVGLSNLSWIRRFWNSNLDNLRLDDEAVMIEEAMQYRRQGGATVVEVSNIGLGRDPEGIRRIARATGLHVVMGSGCYVAPSHPPDMDSRTVEQIEEEIVRDITVGVGDTGIRAGIIGELGCSWPITANERKVLQAGARAQRRTGAPLSIHIGRHEDSPLEIMACLREAGADLGRTIMSHMDRIWPPLDKLKTLARAGCGIGLDTFGQETWMYPFGGADRLSDAQRVDLIKILVAEGFDRQVLVSHDVGYKHRLSSYGGSGLAHVLSTVIPYVMRRKGVEDERINQFLVTNPARYIAFA
ncbi:MAG: aryldialkylphosphatase [Alphaproteobacteria bacterium]|nr:aryldialkylphosphatase [Alphaproteobacteria bacterium]